MSDAHTVLTRAWAGPRRITWKLERRNVPELWVASCPEPSVGEGGDGARGGGLTELSLFLSHLPNLSPTLSLNPSF